MLEYLDAAESNDEYPLEKLATWILFSIFALQTPMVVSVNSVRGTPAVRRSKFAINIMILLGHINFMQATQTTAII